MYCKLIKYYKFTKNEGRTQEIKERKQKGHNLYQNSTTNITYHVRFFFYMYVKLKHTEQAIEIKVLHDKKCSCIKVNSHVDAFIYVYCKNCEIM